MKNLFTNTALMLCALIILGFAPAPAETRHDDSLPDTSPTPDDSQRAIDEASIVIWTGNGVGISPPVDAPGDWFIKDSASQSVGVSRGSTAGPPIGGAIWIAQGPGPNTNGQVENILPDDEVVGAVHTVAAHPTNADILYIGGVNGGLWKTTNATAASPTWTTLSTGLASLSTGALEFDPTDGTHQTLVAGVGRFSSFGSAGGARTGLLRTVNGGTSWTVLDGGGTLVDKNISGVAPRGSIIVTSVNFAEPFFFSNIGIFRSTDTGATFTQISGTGGSGLPDGLSYDLVGHRNAPSVLYTNVIFAGASNGVYKSTDTGATWFRVSDATMNALLVDGDTSNVEMAIHDDPIGGTNAVYVAILNFGQLKNGGFFRSGDGGATWIAMDIPLTNEGGIDIGTNPTFKPDAGVPGGQGAIHFSIVADPDDAFIVYVGGDRQPLEFQNPTSIGAFDFSGRLFRGDASLTLGSQWVHLTHSNVLGAIGGGTANSSAPHADSREMIFDANGEIVEVDDGGIYRRTSPQDNTGDWFSIIGNLQTTEFHDIAYDSNSNIIMGGAQDTGTPQQITPGGLKWFSVSTADGGDVAVDDTSVPGRSTRYSSWQNLGGFRRLTYDAANNLLAPGHVFIALTVVGGGADIVPQFVTPIELNTIDQTRLIIGGANSIYESFDRGDTIAEVGPGIPVNQTAIAYGGRLSGVPNLGVLYVGSGSILYVRTTPTGLIAPTAAAFPGTFIREIVLHPDDWTTAYVMDNSNSVYRTTDAGASWTNVTGDLVGLQNLHGLAYIPSAGENAVVVGTNTGVYLMKTTAPGLWSPIGTNLPNVPVWDLDYDDTDDVLVAGTLGRGAWMVASASAAVLPDCSSVACLGACCGQTTCTDGVLASACTGGGEVWHVGETCDTVCLGSCCTGTNCSDQVTQSTCENGGGVWTLAGDCNSIPCGGACCETLTCTENVDEGSCGGIWFSGADCLSVCTGSCCNGLTCTDSRTQTFCESNIGGVWFSAQACTETFCPCINGTGACDTDHLGLGCEEETCCNAVCTQFPDCCDVGWNASCASEALATCALNDNCADAIEILDGVTPFDTSFATTDGPADCLNGDTRVGTRDLWYTYVATCTGNLTVSLCNNTFYDSTLQVYETTSCSPLGTQLACSDDDCNQGGGPSQVTVAVNECDTVLIRPGGWLDATGPGEIDIICVGTTLGFCCGDGLIDGPETCDDGNTDNGDGCSSTCTVESGYTCDASEPSVCTDDDECTLGTDNCDVNATCVNTPGSFTCTCNSGYSGNGVTCTDDDECTLGTDNCDVNATCANTPGSFTCTCDSGYSGNGVTCTDDDECALGTDNCDPNATCANTPGSFTCTCNSGYTGDGVTCIAVGCTPPDPIIPAPYALLGIGPDGYAPRNRYLSFVPPELPLNAMEMAFRVTFTKMPGPGDCPLVADYSAFENQVMWVGTEVAPINVGASGVLRLQPDPLFQDWSNVVQSYCVGASGAEIGETVPCDSPTIETKCMDNGGTCEPLIIVSDCNIIPCAEYTIDVVTDVCPLEESSFSDPVALPTTDIGAACPGLSPRWADIIGTFDSSTNRYAPADGCVDFNDVAALVERFKNVAKAPPRSWCDLVGGPAPISQETMWQGAMFNVDFLDIEALIAAFKGGEYPLSGPTAPNACP